MENAPFEYACALLPLLGITVPFSDKAEWLVSQLSSFLGVSHTSIWDVLPVYKTLDQREGDAFFQIVRLPKVC